jgi:glycosyltransferase involved in cell wall biosynthesis
MIATRDGGIAEIIRHGENGYLVEREDLEALVQHTKMLVENEGLRHQMGQTARAIVEQKFTDLPIRKLEQAYDQLIG